LPLSGELRLCSLPDVRDKTKSYHNGT